MVRFAVKRLNAEVSTTFGDKSQLKNAILNIALNSQDAMPHGGEIIFKTECVKINNADVPGDIPDGNYIKISIIDTGKGMSEEVRKLIFEPFFTTKERGVGTGMGLPAAYGTIKNHKGVISVASDIDKGTEVTIYLPSHALKKEPEKDDKKAGSDFTYYKHILLVDDEALVCSMTKEVLEKMNFNVSVCHNGKDAVEFYQKEWEEIDIVIIDLVMPELNGKDAFIKMKEINPDIVALISSGYSIDGTAQEVIDLGARGFIKKPFTKKELNEHIARLL